MAEHFPRLFGKYALLKSLARGGMGEIYLAATGRPGGLHKLCVIKKVLTEKTDRAKVSRFLDEAKVVLRLSHANLVSTFDAGDVDGELFIAMELVEGKDLREIWNRCVRTRTRIPVDVALVVVREIARALAYVHGYAGLRLVHRDVAPPNILLSYFGEVKLTDFGLARSTLKQEHTAPGVVFGRASYLAPEQARGEVADARTDVYSLGIVLWELLTGQPYLQLAGLDPVTSLSLVRNPKAQPPSVRAPWIAPELDAVVLKALAPDRTTRFQSAEEMRRSLSDVMTRVAPRADTERIADFLRGLYRDVVGEERTERERLLAGAASLFPEADSPQKTSGSDIDLPRQPDLPQQPGLADDPVGDSLDEPSPSPPASGNEVTVVSARPVEFAAEVAPPNESLAASAQRVRADSQSRQGLGAYYGAEVPTTVWRKSPGRRGEDAAQTFVGRVIDSRYNIQQRIGEGGMGTVYAAEHVEIGKRVAVKILHRLFSGEEQLVERFKGEARAASRVGHPHIVDVTDFGTTEEGCAYFVMEYLEGMDLADVLVQERRLVPERAVRIAVQICQALEAAHNTGVIHRDLKPENIFLVARPEEHDFVKVLDFGIARDLSRESSRLTNPGMAMGTPEYMAPEQVMGRPADRRTDIYAVGALLYEMIMGVAPFKSDSEQEMLQAKRRSSVSLRKQRPDINAGLDAVILRTLDPDPDRRPQTMGDLESELLKIVWEAPDAAPEGLAARSGRKKSPRTPTRPMAEDRSMTPAADSAVKNDSTLGDTRERRRAARRSGKRVGKLGRTGETAKIDDKVDDKIDDKIDEQIGEQTGEQIGQTGDADPLPVSADRPEFPAAHSADTPSVIGAPPPTIGSSTAVNGGPPWAIVARASDVEKLLAAAQSQSPLPIVEGTGDTGSGSSLTRPRTPTAPYGTEVAPPATANLVDQALALPHGISPGPDVALGALIEAVADARVRAGRRSGFVALLVVLLLLAGGVGTSWMAKNGPPPFARHWLDRLTPRSSSKIAVSVAPAPVQAPATVAVTPSSPPPPRSTGAATNVAKPAAVEPPAINDRVPPAAPPIERARTALAAGTPDDAIAALRPIAAAKDQGEARTLLADALVASGWNDARKYHWSMAGRKAREALSLALAAGGPSHGAHALLGEMLYARRDFDGALNEFTLALAESPRDARIKRRVIRSLRQLRGPPTDEKKDEPPSAAAEAASQQ